MRVLLQPFRRILWPAVRLSALALLVVTSRIYAANASLPAPVSLASGAAPGDSGVTTPALFPFLPATDKNSGGAVVIVPGGVSISDLETEGAALAHWLNDRGLAAFVLRYRPAPADPADGRADVARAVQYVRAYAVDYKISPQRIAVLGLAHGAELAAEEAFSDPVAQPDAADALQKVSARPDLLALVWGSALPEAGTANLPPTFLVGSTKAADNLGGMIDLWTRLRAARVPVDAHFFSKADLALGEALNNASATSWPGMFYAWARFSGLLTAAPRVPLKGIVTIDGQVLPHGYVILTSLEGPGAGPVVGRVLNSTAGVPMGEFSVLANQGPVAGRYLVDVRENMTRWLSNSFSGNLVNTRGAPTPEQAYFGHYRVLAPSLGDQLSFTKVHPGDQEPYILEIKPGADANLDLKIEVFSK